VLDGQGIGVLFPYRAGIIFPFLAVPSPVLWLIEPACQWMSLAFFMVVKRTGREAHFSTSSTRVNHTFIWLQSVVLNWAQGKLFRLLSLLENKWVRFLKSCGHLG